MGIKEKVEEFYEEHKLAIGMVVGATVTVVGVVLFMRLRTKPDMLQFVKNNNPEFPIEKTIPEIKEALKGVEGLVLQDALIAVGSEGTRLFIRPAL